MAITAEWYDDGKTILLETFESSWSLEQYRALIDRAAELLASVPHTVDIIVDASRSLTPPAHMTTGLRYALRKVPANQGVTVFVKTDVFMRILIEMARKINPHLGDTLHLVDSLDDALALIEQRRCLPG